jgi:hypothetical protein
MNPEDKSYDENDDNIENYYNDNDDQNEVENEKVKKNYKDKD